MLDLLPDLFDEHPQALRLLNLPWRSFGLHPIIFGPLQTVCCFEDNSRVAEQLALPGNGRVLLVDGGGSNARSLLGDNLVQKAIDNGWGGVIINGAMRDVGTINQMPFGVKALATCPIKTAKRGQGDVEIVIEIAGVEVHPGEYIYADLNGVAVCECELPLPT
ncbi:MULTISPECIES: putative 4-hydroxy-4-methyl-2-oxoglutarate aldolase [Corallincola]|uniref:4-hydroxy-4-methyl-2-oxoglutarate aldolase n=2 Tax=Corallincola TaxID=1775176 RepID=A0ABY1WQC2_9GAMM|nr:MULTISPECIES: putative 4-hydroxy-4-methyl-2-oxoglutarate aldolase [Corallincola]TAA46917.1 putative 4-hydroxy-4-methyl-2-oxoglutarate aldolase [Corallincola spongiicola]TCI04565.1 putative 4-hydroxy-4-methyl-2-oxoglutarate aldolase [Corallincola luteus]